jgi:hypothetical protein
VEIEARFGRDTEGIAKKLTVARYIESSAPESISDFQSFYKEASLCKIDTNLFNCLDRAFSTVLQTYYKNLIEGDLFTLSQQLIISMKKELQIAK